MVTRDLRSSPTPRKPLLPEDPEYQAELRRTYVEWTSGVDLLFGMWLVVSPWVLGYKGAAAWTNVAVGLAILLSAWLQIREPAHMVGLAWVNLVLGAWLVVAPFVLPGVAGPHGNAVHWNNVATGAGVLWFSIWSAAAAP
jgi:hypothetical protein